MKKGFAFVALAALTLAVPAAAERIYVPVLGTTAGSGGFATQVRIANAEGSEGPVAARFRDASGAADLDSERALTARAAVGSRTDLAPAGRTGLLTLDSDSALEVSAWTVDGAGRGVVELPWFTDEEVYSAGVEVPLSELPRPRARASMLIGAANLSEQTASCQATLYSRDGSRTADVQFEVAPMSLARSPLAATGRQAGEVRVTCDQSFYPFGVTADAKGENSIILKGVGPNGSCTAFVTLLQQATGIYIASTQGALFHEATKANPKGIVCIKAPSELKIAKATYEWDVTAGPWSTRDKSGLHNLGYFFLDRYRSGTVGNINQAGPNKNFMKFIQNVGMPAGSNTNAKVGYTMQTGATYHVRYTFDAANKRAQVQVTLNGIMVADFGKETKPGNNGTMIVRPFGRGNLEGVAMVSEFGNYLGQHHPEEASIGWKYSNFRLQLQPK